jgi:hypothetical protein
MLSVAAERSLCWLARYLKRLVSDEHVLSLADVARRLMYIAKRDKWQFVVKTCCLVRSVAAARSLYWLARYLKSFSLFEQRSISPPCQRNKLLNENPKCKYSHNNVHLCTAGHR